MTSVIDTASPGAGMATAHAGMTLLAAPAVPGKHIKVLCLLDLAHILRMVGTNHWKLWAYCIVCFQHVQHLSGKAKPQICGCK